MEMEQFDRFIAEFQPRNTNDLCFEALTWIGTVCEWQAGWKIEEGKYKGDWACIPLIHLEKPEIFPPFGWMPLCDLRILQVS